MKTLLILAVALAAGLLWFALIKAPAMGKETGDAMFAARASAAPRAPVIQEAPDVGGSQAAERPASARAPHVAIEAVSALAAGSNLTEPKVVDVSILYRVKSDRVMATFKRTVEVELFKRESEATLDAICRQLKAANPVVVDRTFINFDVRGELKPPQMSNWAIARFDPELSVRILGDE